MSMTLEIAPFEEAMGKLLKFTIEQFGSVSCSKTYKLEKSQNNTVCLAETNYFLGDSTEPFVHYAGDNYSEKSLIINFKHPFWHSYWEHITGETGPDGLDQAINEYLNGYRDWAAAETSRPGREKEIQAIEKLTGFDKMLEIFKFFYAVYNRFQAGELLFIKDIKGKKEQIDEKNLQTLKEAIEGVKRGSITVLSTLDGFKPDRFTSMVIDGLKPLKIINVNDLDLFSVVGRINDDLKNFFSSLMHLGSLREHPERYFVSSKKSSFWIQQLTNLAENQSRLDAINNEINKYNLGVELKVVKFIPNDLCINDTFYAVRIVNKKTGVSSNLKDVGFGFSQILPIIIQSTLSKEKTLLIEQPELHLHPALQAEMGDLFISSALGEQKNTLLIETHSEHLILRILRRIRETTEGELPEGMPPIKPEDVSVVYVKAGKEGSEAIQIPIKADGDFASDWPDGFFTEREKELF